MFKLDSRVLQILKCYYLMLSIHEVLYYADVLQHNSYVNLFSTDFSTFSLSPVFSNFPKPIIDSLDISFFFGNWFCHLNYSTSKV